ncbi:MAG TPA: hypothetical protein VFR90_15600 [Methylibium sp.]|nr:hypothetical protein [Methylibium sp.]
MALGTTWQRWMRRLRLARRSPHRVPAAKPLPDPADCGTAWGLELTVPKPPGRPQGPRRR